MSIPPARAADAAEIAVALPSVAHDYPAAVLLVDTATNTIVYANDLATQLTPTTSLPAPVEAWSSAAGLQVVGGGTLAASTTPLTQVALGRPQSGREISAELGSDAAGAREALWVIGLPLQTAPEPLRRRSIVVLLPLRFPAAVAQLQGAAAREGAHQSILTSDLAITISDPTAEDDPLVWVSDGFERVTGYQRGEVLGRNCRFLQGPDTDPDAVDRVRAAMAAGVSASETLLNYRADGTAFFNHFVLSPVTDAAGTLVHRVGIQTDITQRVLAERDRAAAIAQAEEARGAQVAAERSGAFGQLLLELSGALTATTTIDDVATTIAAVAREHLGAVGSALALPAPRGAGLELVGDVEHPTDLRPGPAATGAATSAAAAAAPGADSSAHAADATRATATSGRTPVHRSSPMAAAARTRTAGFYPDAASIHAAHAAPEHESLRGEGHDAAAASLSAYAACACLPLALRPETTSEADPQRTAPSTAGALLITWDEPRAFAAEERAVLVALARYTSQALQRAALLAERRSAARLLQQSLLTTLPVVEHLQLAARYVPAATEEYVGGDWYDAVVLPSEATAVVIGDVTGHDLAAAAQMGQLRGLLRAFAYDRQEPPTEIFSRLERALPALGVTTLATAVLATVEAPSKEPGAGSWVLRWTNAGHPPPLLVHPDGRAEALETAPDLLLGLLSGTARSDHTRTLAPGSTVLLYTDGLIEHRGRDLDHGLAQLAAVVTASAHLPPAELLDVLVTELVGDHPEDDCALMAVRLLP